MLLIYFLKLFFYFLLFVLILTADVYIYDKLIWSRRCGVMGLLMVRYLEVLSSFFASPSLSKEVMGPYATGINVRSYGLPLAGVFLIILIGSIPYIILRYYYIFFLYSALNIFFSEVASELAFVSKTTMYDELDFNNIDLIELDALHLHKNVVITLWTQILYIVFVAVIWFTFNNTYSGFQYFFTKSMYFDYFLNTFNTPVVIGIDGISIFFLNLTAFFGPIITIVGLSTTFLIKKPSNLNFFLVSVLFSQVMLSLSFCILDFFWFFFFFESVIIPSFYLIYIHGKTEKKLKATYYFVLYTLIASTPFFVFLLTIINIHGTACYTYLRHYSNFTEYQGRLFCLMVFITFLCKIPSFPFYVWLPEAHVEAGTAGSILLASLILKLGIYGILRFVVPIFPLYVAFFSPFFIFFACLSMFHAAVLASQDLDLKKIIAYSSVSHMNFCMVGLISYTIASLQGSLLFSLSHSFVSSGLFLLVGFLYDRYHSRDIKIFGSLSSTMPIYSSFFFLFSLANCSMPGSISFVSELLLLLGLFSFSKFTYLCSMVSSVFWSFYSLNVFTKLCFGYARSSALLKGYYDLTKKEFYLVFYLLLFTVILGIKPNVILDTSYMPLLNIRSSIYV